jgi:hypothetical protein
MEVSEGADGRPSWLHLQGLISVNFQALNPAWWLRREF